MNKLNKAIILASKIHSGKKGKNKESAILHPIRVMQKMDNNKNKIIAILHDVVETGKISIIDLEEMGFNKKICKAKYHQRKTQTQRIKNMQPPAAR